MIEFIIKRFVYYANPWAHIHSHANHACDVVNMPLSEALSSIEWVYPDNHIIFVNLIREFIEIPVGIWGRLAKDRFLVT